MVIARHGNHTAMLGGTCHIGVLQGICTAVYPWALAVPEAKHAIKSLCFGMQVQLLGAPDCSSTQFLVHARLEDDVVLGQVRLGFPQGLVVSPQGRASVTADEACGVQARHGISRLLEDRKADQGLNPTHESAASLQGVLVVQRQVGQGLQHMVGQRSIHEPPPSMHNPV